MKKIALESIELDTSIQCRSHIDVELVNEYAIRMTEGDVFPPIVLFGKPDRYWIGDGWHRVMAARERKSRTISAEVHRGGRTDALKHALGANALHGYRRTNADKRRCIEIAVREFPRLSARALAKMCGVSNSTVRQVMPNENCTIRAVDGKPDRPTRLIGLDGKERPAHAGQAKPEEPSAGGTKGGEDLPPDLATRKLSPDSMGLQFADMAILDLEQIPPGDLQRREALRKVRRWIDEHEEE
jgi:hypothetical protein